jgi:hypothetical protein
MKFSNTKSVVGLSLVCVLISGCSAVGGVKSEDKKALGEFCSEYQNYASNSVALAEKSRLEFIDLTPVVSPYDSNESIEALKSAMVDVNTHFSWAEAEEKYMIAEAIYNYMAQGDSLATASSKTDEFRDLWNSSSINRAEQDLQSIVGKTPPISAFVVEANLKGACSKFLD